MSTIFSNFLYRSVFYFSQSRAFNYFTILMALCLITFLVSWFSEPRRLINGLFFTAFIASFIAWFTFLVYATRLMKFREVYEYIIFGIIGFVVLFVFFLWAFLLWNSYFVMKHESRSLPNSLTFILGIALLVLWIFMALTHASRDLPQWIRLLLDIIPSIAAYLGIVMYNFLINLILYQIVPRHYNQDYLIVLGANLVNGNQVSNLLASRINRAIQFSLRQVAAGKKQPKIIMSGGKNGKEKVSEASAMANYAVMHGIDPEYILLEDNSSNTEENMIFSRELASQDFGSDNFKATFFTSNYHLFRSALYARLANLNANGVGAYTRPYYLPTATLREFAGVVVMNRKRHFTVIGLIIAAYIILAVCSGAGIL